MRITKIMTFDAAHKLPDKTQYGKCRNLHGHTYKLEVTVEGPITEDGWVMNFKLLKNIMGNLIDKYDHSYLNEQPEFEIRGITTAEIIVDYIWHWLNEAFHEMQQNGEAKMLFHLHKVKLWETPTSYAEQEA